MYKPQGFISIIAPKIKDLKNLSRNFMKILSTAPLYKGFGKKKKETLKRT